jgi:hypothetical protein
MVQIENADFQIKNRKKKEKRKNQAEVVRCCAWIGDTGQAMYMWRQPLSVVAASRATFGRNYAGKA